MIQQGGFSLTVSTGGFPRGLQHAPSSPHTLALHRCSQAGGPNVTPEMTDGSCSCWNGPACHGETQHADSGINMAVAVAVGTAGGIVVAPLTYCTNVTMYVCTYVLQAPILLVADA